MPDPKIIRIWLIEGKTGEYDDTHRWPVRAVNSKEKARRLCGEWDTYANIIHEKYQELGPEDDYTDLYETHPDPHFDMDPYTGTEYFYSPLDLYV